MDPPDLSLSIDPNPSFSEFLSSFNLEFRSILTVIVGYSQLLLAEEAGPLNEEQTNFAKIIHDGTKRAYRAFDDFLLLTRIKSGSLALRVEPVNIKSCVDETIAGFQDEVKSKDQTLTVELADLPLVRANEWLLHRILFILLENAHKYTPPKGKIVVSAEKLNDFVKFKIMDTGIGISPNNQERIFEEFFRASVPMVQQQDGLGLGLSISKYLIEHFGGQIGIESKPDSGSTFWFTIPIVTTS